MAFKHKEQDGWEDFPSATTESTKTDTPELRQPFLVKISDIYRGNKGRSLDKRKLGQIERSINDQGLRQPVHVYKRKNCRKGSYGLIAGQHRLQALQNLGHKNVPVVVLDRCEAKAWRASENLHRYELRPLERSEAIVEYGTQRIRLPNVKGDEKIRGGRQPHDRGYSKLAAATGFDHKRIAEAYNHASLPDSVKNAILRRRSLNTRVTLNLLVEMETEEEQLSFIRGHSRAKLPHTRSASKMGEGKRSKRPRNGWMHNISVAAMKSKWKVATFRKFYEKQPAGARKDFVLQLLKKIK